MLVDHNAAIAAAGRFEGLDDGATALMTAVVGKWNVLLGTISSDAYLDAAKQVPPLYKSPLRLAADGTTPEQAVKAGRIQEGSDTEHALEIVSALAVDCAAR